MSLIEVIEVEDDDDVVVQQAKRQRVADVVDACPICLEEIVDDTALEYRCSTGKHRQCMDCFLRALIVYHTDESWSCEKSTQIQQCTADDCKDRCVPYSGAHRPGSAMSLCTLISVCVLYTVFCSWFS